LEDYYSLPRVYLSKYLYSFRLEYQPLGIIGNWLGDGLWGKFLYKFKLLTIDDMETKGLNDTPINLGKELISDDNKVAQFVDSARVKQQIEFLLSKVTTLGIKKIIFIEFPQSVGLYYSPKLVYLRSLANELASNKKVVFWGLDSYERYTTTDGVHLDNVSVEHFIANTFQQ
jgi:hypothetical protein